MTRAPVEVDSSDMAMSSRALRLAWRFHRRFMMWLKALASLVMMGGGTITTLYSPDDIKAYLSTIFHDSVKLPTIIAIATVAYLAINLACKLPKGFSANIKLNDGE